VPYKNEILNWWISKLSKFNSVFLISGVICFLLLYFGALFFNRPIYFFFMLPFAGVYILLLNVLYMVSGAVYYWLAGRVGSIVDSLKMRKRIFKFVTYIAIGLNFTILVICLIGFKIIKFF